MRIEGDTAIFKSEFAPFVFEWHGEKPNTVRKIPSNELSDFLRWSDNDNLKIEIELANTERYNPEYLPPVTTFTRTVTNVYELGEILGEYLFVISWRHEE